MRKSRIFISAVLLLIILSSGSGINADSQSAVNPVPFVEIWGYLMRGEEKLFRGDEPVTDIFYFSCTLNFRGKLNTDVRPPVLPGAGNNTRRVHIVIADLSNTSLMHFVLNNSNTTRDELVKDIVKVSEDFDGVQIDFESVAGSDRDAFVEFLALLKDSLPAGKVLSVALPARRKSVPDAYPYKAIAAVVDRVFIMTYDQHWSTGTPGPVASYSWCREVVKYASHEIPAEKLVMGIPFYGRSWQDKSHNKAIRTKNLDEVLAGDDIVKEYSADSGYKVTFKDTVNVTLYCDDTAGIRAKLDLYKKYVNSVGFWRLGFQNPDIWREITAGSIEH